jgi:hypothetical protein
MTPEKKAAILKELVNGNYDSTNGRNGIESFIKRLDNALESKELTHDEALELVIEYSKSAGKQTTKT